MKSYRGQRGAVLITSLILLLILTLLGVASMRNTTLEEKMAGNMHNRHLAEQAADAGLRGAEDWLLGLKVPPVASASCESSGSTVTKCLAFALDPDESNAKPWWRETDATWWESTATTSVTVNNLPKPAAYVVEDRALVPEGQSLALGMAQDLERMTRFYEMTARGVDASGRAEAISRTTFAAPNF
jgi:type IV pilus assembly protein PilX